MKPVKEFLFTFFTKIEANKVNICAESQRCFSNRLGVMIYLFLTHIDKTDAKRGEIGHNVHINLLAYFDLRNHYVIPTFFKDPE